MSAAKSLSSVPCVPCLQSLGLLVRGLAAFVFLPSMMFATLVGPARAATITWGTATNISGDSDVITTGGFIQAWNFGTLTSGTAGTAVDTTVNGVLFSAAGVVSTGTDTVSFVRVWPFGTPTVTLSTPGSNTVFGWNAGVAGITTPYTGLSSSYQAMLSTVVFGAPTSPANTMQVTFSDLTVGAPYLIQVWVNESRSNFTNTRNGFITSTGTSVAVDYNTTNTGGGLGQWLSGTFTADATSQTFNTVGNGNAAYINAIQLRVVPEPSTIMMAGIGVASIFFLRSVVSRRTSPVPPDSSV
jgi:hypothetical protein